MSNICLQKVVERKNKVAENANTRVKYKYLSVELCIFGLIYTLNRQKVVAFIYFRLRIIFTEQTCAHIQGIWHLFHCNRWTLKQTKRRTTLNKSAILWCSVSSATGGQALLARLEQSSGFHAMASSQTKLRLQVDSEPRNLLFLPVRAAV